MKDRKMILAATTDANEEIAKATSYAVTIQKGKCAEEHMLADHLLTARKRIDQALEELNEE